MDWNRWDKEALDRWITRDPENQPEWSDTDDYSDDTEDEPDLERSEHRN
jgi:hypothetical protein